MSALVAHLDNGECYAAEARRSEDVGPWIVGVIEAAHALARVTTHANVRGPEYAERKDYYALLRKQLADPRLRSTLVALGLEK